MPTKEELLAQFEELQKPAVVDDNVDCVDCKHCTACVDCANCTACSFCGNCYHCEGCDAVNNAVLCTGLEYTHPDKYYLLNEEVTQAEFDAAVQALAYGAGD